MTERFYLHIGAPKTGTTYLQQVLARNRAQLSADGVLYPKVAGDAHHTSLWDLRREWQQRDFGKDIRGHWDEAVRLVTDWGGPVAVMSSELFVYAEPEESLRAVNAFGDIDVHVVYTARDLIRQAPAMWQERVKNQRTLSYDEFLTDLVTKSRTPMAKHFWKAQDASAALRDWSQGLPAHHVHVVTAPTAGAPPSLLWERFASVLGIDGSAYDTDVPVLNTSMSVTSAEVLRRYNIRHGKNLTLLQYRRRLVVAGLLEVLAEAVGDTSRLTLSPAQERALSARAQLIARAIGERGYDVVGSLSELTPEPGSRLLAAVKPGKQPNDLTADDICDALLDVVDHLLRDRGKKKPRRRRTRG